jgi:hypothetical protein
MPVKRRVAKLKAHRITEAAIAAFKAGAWLDLQRALGLKPWEMSPLDAGPTPPSWRKTTDDWQQAVELRQALEDAVKGGPS